MQRFALSRDDRSERAKTVRSKYPEKSVSDNRTKPIWEDGSETALYRGSGRLFKPRPGPTSPDPNKRGAHADAAALMAQINAILETWIRDRPEQWLWLHQRWPD
jgi:hypothetical protein